MAESHAPQSRTATNVTGAGVPFLQPSIMGDRVRTFNWASTPLGPMETWPQSLRTAVGICLNSPLPMFVWWGRSLINLYNDAYAPVLGLRHPSALGRPAREVWADIWADIESDVNDVVTKGISIHRSRVRFLMQRNDYTEETFFSYAHSPIPDDNGGIGGLFQVCTDETASVHAEQRLALLRKLSETFQTLTSPEALPLAAVEILGKHLNANRVGYAVVEPDGQSLTIETSYADGVEPLRGRFPVESFGKNLLAAHRAGRVAAVYDVLDDPNLQQETWASIRVRAFVSVPLIREGALRATLFVNSAQPRRWNDGEVLLIESVANRTWDALQRARAEVVQSQVTRQMVDQARRFDHMLSSISDYCFALDNRCRFTFANKPLLEQWGLTLEQATGRTPFEMGLPRDRVAAFVAHVQQVIDTGQAVSEAASRPDPRGGLRHYQYILTPMFAPDGGVEGVAGVSRDVSDLKAIEIKLRESEARFRTMADSSPLMVWVTDQSGACTYLNKQWFQFTGQAPEEGLGTGWLRAVHPEDRPRVEQTFLDHAAGGESFRLEYRLRRHDGVYRWVIDAAAPRRGEEDALLGYIGSVIDIQDRKQTEEALSENKSALERQRRVYEAILNNTPDLAYVFDLQHRFIYANDVLLKMWGKTAEQAIGRTFLELGYEPWHAAMHDREIDQVVATRQPIRGEVPFNGTFGRRIYDYIFVPVLGADGNVAVVAGTTRDITDRKIAEEQREHLLASERKARGEAERAGRMKDEFLATLSHELRTPLTAVLGWAELLLKKPASAPVLAQGLAVIERNARMQSQLIDDLLDMNRILSGKMRLEVRPMRIESIIEAALDSIRPAAAARNINLTFEPQAIAEPVYADAARFQQVVWNLLSNAVKFTPKEGSVRVTLRRHGSNIEVAVADTGKGIRPEFLPHVFERFRQADSSSAREHGGLGLGLAIVKQLVELHGGTVHAASGGLDAGSTFTVHLPLGAPSAQAATPAASKPDTNAPSPSLETPDFAGKRILLIEDMPDTRDLVRRLLEDCRAQVAAASAADEALHALNLQPFDLVVSDIALPGQDGYELIRAIRDRGFHGPAIALSAFVRVEDRDRALKAGFQAHVGKPVNAAELYSVIGRLTRPQSVPPIP